MLKKIRYKIRIFRFGKHCENCGIKYIPPPHKTRFSCATEAYCAGCAYDMDSYRMSEEEQWGYGDDY